MRRSARNLPHHVAHVEFFSALTVSRECSAEIDRMSTDPKSAKSSIASPAVKRDKGVKIFTYPKVVYLFPTLIVSLVCWAGMWMIAEKRLADPSKSTPVVAGVAADAGDTAPSSPTTSKLERFGRAENLLGVLFLTILAFNLIVMALDFPRFTVLGVGFAALFILFFILWLGSYYELNLMKPVDFILSRVYAVAYPGFYLAYFVIISLVFVVIYLTRWLDYWEVLPNEILHHHGPLSDLERFPTLNLKFDKEIPDVFEFMLLGAGKLVMHVPNVDKAIVMDNVLFINSKEEALKKLMSRLDVRITTDQETDLR